ncbi:MAG: polysaccharide biosynthesis C-terminal domain-containing protein, partial [Cytophagales bacterium]
KNLVQRYLQGLGKTKTNLKMTLLEAFTSVFLAYVFMYGKLGWPRMGLLGSALSFLTSQLLVAIVCGYQLTQLQRRGKVLLSFHACKQVRFKALKKIFLLGIFLGLSYSCRTAFNSAIMIIAGRLGETQLRVFSSIKTIRRPCYAIIFSVAAMGRILISKYQHQPEKKRNISHFSYILITLASFLIGAVLYLGGTPMLRWMDKTATPAFLTHCQQILPFEMLFIWIDGLAFLSIALLAGTKVTVYPAFIVFFTSFTIGCPLANILANDFNLGLEGIYIALCSSALIAFIATYGYLHHKTKNHPLATSIS